jgi:lipoprotein-anchoring transpeptidase ErfK/SrfK
MLLVVPVCLIAFAALLAVDGAGAQGAVAGRAHHPTACSTVPGAPVVRGVTDAVAWRAGIEQRTAVYYRLPGAKPKASRWVGPGDAPWLLVLGRARAADGRCWVRVRLPWRPNGAAGWVNANNVLLQRTPWRIAVSTKHRALTLWHAGVSVRSIRVVVGKSSTPTPVGIFAVVWAVPWHPSDFLGSWVLLLTAHSNVLQQFDGGNGTVGIHGRGGASFLDPLGSARSHGCIRLANGDIDWLVHTIGRDRLPGTPVEVS